MDAREKLVELLKTNACPSPFICDQACKYYGYGDCFPYRFADYLIANGVTVQEDCKNCAEATQNCIVKLQEQIAELRSVQEWVSVKDRLPEENHDGSVNAVLVTDGFVQHMAYFARGEWRFAESGEIKEPMWYSITHWMPLPEPPKGE